MSFIVICHAGMKGTVTQETVTTYSSSLGQCVSRLPSAVSKSIMSAPDINMANCSILLIKACLKF